MSLRWLHLSDFHSGKDGYGQRHLYSEVLSITSRRVEEGRYPHLVLLTGDIANKGKASEYGAFKREFLQPLVELISQARPPNIFLIPGNHDVDRDTSAPAVPYDHHKQHERFFDPTSEGREARSVLFPRFEAFHSFLDGAGYSGQRLDGVTPYFCEHLSIGQLRVGVLGINTAWLSQDPEGIGNRIQGRWTEEFLLSPGLQAVRDGAKSLEGCNIIFALGHHPISSYTPEDQGPVLHVLGKYPCLYLCGHLHKSASNVFEVGHRGLRELQAGAAFQEREHDLWRNRFMFCEISNGGSHVKAEPYMWSRENQDWVLDSEAFEPGLLSTNAWQLPLPWGNGAENAKRPKWSPPNGWQLIDRGALGSYGTGLTEDELAAFFDGAIPTWRIALAPSVRRWRSTRLLLQLFQSRVGERRKPLIRLISGPGGEGKSTVLRQVLCDLVRSENRWRVLWAVEPRPSLSARDLLTLPTLEGPWVVAADDAERIAGECAAAAKFLWGEGRFDIHFLLAARDTDWRALGGPRFTWGEWSDFEEVGLHGLSYEDSSAVVESWLELGDRGLGELSQTPPAERVPRLYEAAQEESEIPGGSFLGAMIRVRFGEALTEHVRKLMQRLDERRALQDDSLLDALLYIAAPHSQNILALSLEVLAEIFRSHPHVANRYVVQPLGKEAAATSDGRFLLVRHRAVAELLMELAVKEFGRNEAEYFSQVACAASRLRDRVYVYRFNALVFMSQSLRERQKNPRPDLAVEVAKALVAQEPTQRPYLGELGVAYGSLDPPDWAMNAIVSAASLADMKDSGPTNDNAKFALAQIGLALGHLFERSGDSVFAEGQSAAAVLGLELELDESSYNFLQSSLEKAADRGVPESEPRAALTRLSDAVRAAWKLRSSAYPVKVRRPENLRFSGLGKLLHLV